MVGLLEETATCLRYPVGTRIKIGDNYGTVRYVGEVVGYSGIWLGVEWDDPLRGKHNGVVDGKHYFYAMHPTSGSFIRPGKIGPFESLEEAVRERYLCDSEKSLDQNLLHEAQESLQASLFEVVGLDKLARKQSKFEQLTDISLTNCPINSSGYLREFASLTNLNLSQTLIWNWSTVAQICSQVPTLTHINLSCNRFVTPRDTEIMELLPAFNNLKSMNLGNCGFKEWSQVTQTARLWPYIISLGLQENPISELDVVNTKEIFKNLQELDLHHTKIMDFDQVCKLGNIRTLVSLNIMENGIQEIKLPYCEPNAKLNIFQSLEQLNILHNPIWNEIDIFNELDKLSSLKRLNKTPHMKSGFDEMFVNAAALISGLEILNKAQISAEERRGAEYDIWKKYGVEWLEASKSPDTLREFYKKYRTYASLIKKYGSPAEFVSPHINLPKLIKIFILNKRTGELWEKKIPRTLTVQTLLALILKQFRLNNIEMTPRLCYIDAKHPEVIVPLDNSSKSLDFYSVQENNIVQLDY